MRLGAVDLAALQGLWGQRCAYCGGSVKDGTADQMAVDHLVPVSRGGSDALANLAYCCRSCNSSKGAKTAAEFGRPEVAERAAEIARLVVGWLDPGPEGTHEIWVHYPPPVIRLVSVSALCRGEAGPLPLARPWFELGLLTWPKREDEWRAEGFERLMKAQA